MMKIIANPGSLYNSRTLKKNSSALWGRSRVKSTTLNLYHYHYTFIYAHVLLLIHKLKTDGTIFW